MDKTFRKKTGKKIPKVSTLQEPMSLPYHINLTPAIRFVQASAIINPQNRIEVSRAIPIYFQEAAPAKKPTRMHRKRSNSNITNNNQNTFFSRTESTISMTKKVNEKNN